MIRKTSGPGISPPSEGLCISSILFASDRLDCKIACNRIVDHIVNFALLRLHIKLNLLEISFLLAQIVFPYILCDAYQIFGRVCLAGKLKLNGLLNCCLFLCRFLLNRFLNCSLLLCCSLLNSCFLLCCLLNRSFLFCCRFLRLFLNCCLLGFFFDNCLNRFLFLYFCCGYDCCLNLVI